MAAKANGTLIKRPNAQGYERLKGRKGTLDQRLRAVVAYKRAGSINYNDISMSSREETAEQRERREERELFEMMESDDDDEEILLDDDDEELIYERMITEVVVYTIYKMFCSLRAMAILTGNTGEQVGRTTEKFRD